MRPTHLAPLLLALGSFSCTTAVAPAMCSPTEIQGCLATQRACDPSTGTAVCAACDPGMHPTEEGLCEPLEGTAITHDFPDQTIAAHAELLRYCRSWTLHNDQDLWVNGVELTQHESSHHSNWTYVPEDMYPGADGIWPCADRGYDQLTAAVAGGVLYAQSTQATHEVQAFPHGAAVRIPAHSTIVSDIHLLNLTDTDVTGHVTMSLYTLPAEQVTIRLTPFHITYQDLALPPHQASRASTTCDIRTGFEQQTGGPLSMRLYYSLPHTHALGTRVFLEAVGGPNDGMSLLDVQGAPGEARGIAYTPPIDLSTVNGLRFGCEFFNPTTDVVHWGFGDQEMCEMLGFIESPLAFEGRVGTTSMTGTDGTMATQTGDCTMFFVTLASGQP
ncbi:MAG: hypothetical protein U0234_22000 [Sandaracinus sp.]